MRHYLFLLLAMAGPAAAAPDGDTVCATLYTYLAESARDSGMSGLYFDTAALKAEEAHLRRNPTEDRERYTLEVIDGAANIRDGLARGTIAADAVVSTATRCNATYYPNTAVAPDPLGDQTVTP